MALELLLPFLLDADASPARLTSAARSRGSLYERVMAGGDGTSRSGFVWVEFARGEEVFTVGARIRAKESTRKIDLDFFTTSQLVGVDLALLDEHRTPLSRKGLVAAISDRGRVHDSAEEHRAAVRDVLFPGFGPGRYASVITALLALRKEKLSQNLDLDKLSGVLSEALPALDDHDLAAVAEGFERLDRRRSELAALASELEQARALASRQRAYARAVVAGAAAAVRSAETRRDDLTRAEREARAALDDARAEALALGAEAATTEATALGPDDGERLLQAWARAQQRRIAEVRAALDAHRTAVGQRTFAEERVGKDEATLEQRRSYGQRGWRLLYQWPHSVRTTWPRRSASSL